MSVQIPLWTIVTKGLGLVEKVDPVQIPLWTIVTVFGAAADLLEGCSDSSMDDCNFEKG